MDTKEFFLASDAALQQVLDSLSEEDLATAVPAEWSRTVAEPVVRDVAAALAYDEAWVPDVLDGRAVEDGDPWIGRDLLGDDPASAYGVLRERAERAVAEADPDATVRFKYGEYPAAEGLSHLAFYRALVARDVAHLLDPAAHAPRAVVQGLDEHVVPHAEQWRAWGVLPPAVEPPSGADEETRVLCALGRTP